jgi:fatty acid desaturase
MILGVAWLSQSNIFSGIYGFLLICPMVWYFCALRLRGFECLLHEASHFNWTRRRWLNDILANLMVAPIVLVTVKSYRRSHTKHHVLFGTASDTDKNRLELIKADDLDRRTITSLIRGLMIRLKCHQLIWLRDLNFLGEILLYFLPWHCFIVILPLALLVGFATSLKLWLIYYLVPLMVFLPPLRLLVESGKHVYRNTSSVFEASVITKGRVLRYLLYPHNDSFHGLHHLVPGIPHHRLKQAHRFLIRHDPLIYGRFHRYRTAITHPVQPADSK